MRGLHIGLALFLLPCLAHAAEPAPKPGAIARCIHHLTADPAGPRLDARNVPVGLTVWIDRAPYRVYEGRLLEDICEEAVARRAEVAGYSATIAQLRTENSRLRDDVRTMGRRLDAHLSDPVRRHAYVSFAVSIVLAAFFIATLFLCAFGARIRRAFRAMRSRRQASRFRTAGIRRRIGKRPMASRLIRPRLTS